MTESISGSSEADTYEIRVRGHLDRRWAAWFDGLVLTREEGGTSLIRGRVADQAALHGLLQKIRDIGLPLISVVPVDLAWPNPIPDPNQQQPRRSAT